MSYIQREKESERERGIGEIEGTFHHLFPPPLPLPSVPPILLLPLSLPSFSSPPFPLPIYILPFPSTSLPPRVCILIMCVHFSSDYNPVLPIGTDALTEEANRIAAELGTPVSDFLASDEFTSVDPETLELDPDEVAILQALLEVIYTLSPLAREE